MAQRWPWNSAPEYQPSIVPQSQTAAYDIEDLDNDPNTVVTSTVLAPLAQTTGRGERIPATNRYDHLRVVNSHYHHGAFSYSTESLVSSPNQLNGFTTTQRLYITSEKSARRVHTCWRCKKYKKAVSSNWWLLSSHFDKILVRRWESLSFL